MDEQLARELAERFDEFGLRFLEPIDLTEISPRETVPVTLSHEQGRAAYRVGYADTLIVSSLDWAKPHFLGNERLLLLGPRVTERSAEMFRQLGINYLDAAGNAFITFDGVRIDVRGRRPQAPVLAGLPRLTRGGVNLFSAKRSQVIFAILSWPELLESPIREIARTAGVSLGQAQETLELLTQYGFLDDRRQLVRSQRDRLIDQWATAFPTSLGVEAKTGRFSGQWQGFEPGGTMVFVSGEAAVPGLLRPETVVLYTDEFPTELIRANRWRRNEAQPNIFLRRQFWQSPDAPTGPGVHEAPWLLVYADLLASNDSRQRDAAEQFREQQR
ncbi:type IV toxin-antitoxin system AbiEi family antitoxin [Leucobacter sp. W1038]|uniref:type IV toxin-antitoxin system AbiEi family antitoxin n=1 Tax=Leucobacter sp. W1038 TaxID=3438281 RepID=UPI003D95E466